jgi:hypothetical protein
VTVASAAGLAGAFALPAAAQAQVVTNGSFSMSGDSGDYITQGLSYAYAAAKGDRLNVTGGPGIISLSIDGANGDWWSLDLEAPAGQTLQPGTYTGARRYPFNDDAPGLDVSGNGRGCNTLTGSFVIESYTPGLSGDVEALQATFEQHCEGGAAALRGSVTIGSPVPPTVPVLGATVAADGTFSKLNGRATVHGTVNCTADVPVTVAGEVTQVKKKVLITGVFTTTVDCVAGEPVDWTVTAKPTGTTPFQKGDAEVDATASATGAKPVSVVATVKLTKA